MPLATVTADKLADLEPEKLGIYVVLLTGKRRKITARKGIS
jgi:hypothetical protein